MDGSFAFLEKPAQSRLRSRYRNSENDLRSSFDIPRQPAGNLAVQRLLRAEAIYPKVAISHPGDSREQEANRLADHVMHMPAPIIQSSCAPINGATADAIGENDSLERKCDHNNSSSTTAAGDGFVSGFGTGHALDATTRTFFENRFARNLSGVRVHADDQAAASAAAIQAEAFTVGPNIFFAANRYDPSTFTGKRLLGHELAHVIQQASGFDKSTRTNQAGAGATTIIHRQPAPGPTAEPVAFIENQLKIRFTDPEDPRLIVRVQQLQQAFSLLTIAEARRLLNRLRESGDELAKNFQRLATPSRNKLRAILLRSLPAEVEGKVLGWASTAAAPISVPLVAKIEVTPSTAEAEMFEGYGDIAVARDAVRRRATICAIVFDKKLGRYRAFETGVPTIRGVADLRVAAAEGGVDYELVDWVNLEGQEPAARQDRLARIIKARKLLDDYVKTYRYSFIRPTPAGMAALDPAQERSLKEVENAYEELFEEALPFAKGEFHFAFEFAAPTAAGQSRELTTADPSRINIDLLDIYAHGRQKMLDPTEDLDYPGGPRRVTMKEALEEASPLPYEPYIALAPGSLEDEPLETRRVFLHERAHLAHAQRSIQLIELWKAGSPATPFKDWIQNEVKQRRVSSVDAILAIERIEQPSSSLAFNTEVLAEVEGFVSVYHVEPAVKNLALERLPILMNEWLNADPEVQELALRKLRHYYWQILDQAHRDTFDEYVLDKLFQNTSGPSAVFYQRLSEFSATP